MVIGLSFEKSLRKIFVRKKTKPKNDRNPMIPTLDNKNVTNEDGRLLPHPAPRK